MLIKKIVQFTTCYILALSCTTLAVAEVLTIPGSGNSEHVLGELAKAFNTQQERYQVVIPPSIGTAGALREVTEGKASIGRVGRPLKKAELASGLVFHSLGRDPVLFVGGAGVSVKRVTRAQMVDVYSGKLKNWSELGGKPGPIRVIGREQTDASLQAISNEIKAFSGMVMHEDVKIVHLDPQMIELLDRFPTSLGFLNRSALSAAKTKLVLFNLDLVEPRPENVASARYPLWVEFGFVYKEGNLSEAAWAFLKFVESPAGIQILQAHGVLPASKVN